MHAKPDLRAEFEPTGHCFRLGDLCRYPLLINQMPDEFDFDAPIYQWLLQNKAEIIEGTADYHGQLIDEQTILKQFTIVYSFLVFSWTKSTNYMIPCSKNGYLKFAGISYSLFSLLFGWWSLPMGPILTISTIYTNCTGGRKRTAMNLIQKMEHGWDMPINASNSQHRRDILIFSETALAELRKQRSTEGFSPNLAVRVTPNQLPQVSVGFDYPVSDGADWIGTFEEFDVLIDKRDELRLLGMTIEFDGTGFRASNLQSNNRG